MRDPWTLEWSRELKALAAEAQVADVHLATATSLVIERELISRDLDALCGEGCARHLDRRAATAQIRHELSGADALYLRSLRAGSGATAGVTGNPVTLALPSRLSSRILYEGGPGNLVGSDCLAQSITWEVAALMQGRTMTEWALAVALVRGQPVAVR